MEDPNFMAYCGTNCRVCSFRIAYITNDERLKEKLAKMIGIKPDQIICEGCRSEEPLFICKMCPMKSCVLKKGYESCVDCDEFPCKIIERFPVKEFIKKVKFDVNYRKKHSKEDWIVKTIELNSCPSCQTLAHWRGRICKSCGTQLKARYL